MSYVDFWWWRNLLFLYRAHQKLKENISFKGQQLTGELLVLINQHPAVMFWSFYAAGHLKRGLQLLQSDYNLLRNRPDSRIKSKCHMIDYLKLCCVF